VHPELINHHARSRAQPAQIRITWPEKINLGTVQDVGCICQSETAIDISGVLETLSLLIGCAHPFLAEDELSIQGYEALMHNVNRRTWQRDLRGMVDKQLLIVTGATNRAIYRLRSES